MSVTLYMDVHIQRAIWTALRRRGVDVLTAQEDGTTTVVDPDLLDRALALGRVLFTYDVDFVIEGTRRQHVAQPFAGVVYVHQEKLPIGKTIDDLEILAKASEPADLMNRIVFLPL